MRALLFLLALATVVTTPLHSHAQEDLDSFRSTSNNRSLPDSTQFHCKEHPRDTFNRELPS